MHKTGTHTGVVMYVGLLDKIWYECYDIGVHPKNVYFNFLELVTEKWQKHESVRR
jgi:hypothetical protein